MSQPIEHLFLEESYVLRLRIEPLLIELKMDFVLTPQHPDYRPPPPDSWQCYKRGFIRVEKYQKVVWHASNFQPSRDATGEIDYGNLDAFTIHEHGFRFEGDWGLIEVDGGSYAVGFDEAQQ